MWIDFSSGYDEQAFFQILPREDTSARAGCGFAWLTGAIPFTFAIPFCWMSALRPILDNAFYDTRIRMHCYIMLPICTNYEAPSWIVDRL